MAELFETDRTSIVRHINNIYRVDELEREATCAKITQVQTEGKRHIETKEGGQGQGDRNILKKGQITIIN